MRKYLFLITTILCSLSAKAINVSNIYITGDAMPCGWTNTNPEAMEVFDATEGIFVWSGNVNTGNFKFLLESGKWANCLNAVIDKESILVGEEHALVHVSNYFRRGNDFPFRFAESGVYTIIVYTKEMKMVVKKKETSILPSNLWVTGSAIPNKVAKLTIDPTQTDGNFRFHGKLLAGEFKIIDTPTINAETHFYTPCEEDANAAGTSFIQISDNANLPGWNVTVPDDSYKIKINTTAGILGGRIFVAREDLFIVGGATGIGWNAGQAIRMIKNADNPNLFTFSGVLKKAESGNDRNMFKLLGQNDWGPVSFHPYAQREIVLGSKYIFENLPGDHKWIVDSDKEGNYDIRVDLLEETIVAKYNGSKPSEQVKEETDNRYIISIKNAKIHVSSKNGGDFDYVALLDGDGKTIISPVKQKSKFWIGKGLKKGTYLLELSQNNKVTVKKVVII